MLAQALVADRVPVPLGAGWSLLASLLAGVGSLLAGRRRAWAGWALALAAVAAGAGVVSSGYLVALVPLALAGTVGAWAARHGAPP